MSPHHGIIEAGPTTVRRLCCRTTDSEAVSADMVATALAAVDDKVTLLDEHPVAVDSLWRTVLRSVHCGRGDAVAVVHPSWWAPARVQLITAAASDLADRVVTRQRSWLLAQASPTPARNATVVVEIAERFVAVTGTAVVGEQRRGEPAGVAEAVTAAILAVASEATSAVVIDAPGAVAGAAALATMIADAVRRSRADLQALCVDDARLQRLAGAAFSVRDGHAPPPGRSAPGRGKAVRAALLGTAVVAAAALTVAGFAGRHTAPAPSAIATTYLVEGRVALSVPQQWSVQRVVGGPGSARIQVTSPSDQQLALHVRQSPVADQTLQATAESLKRAIDAEPAGVFVDFNPSGSSGGRPAVTYREVRAGHDIRWTVLLDGSVRISIGCQSPSGGEAAIREACEQAVRSAHALR